MPDQKTLLRVVPNNIISLFRTEKVVSKPVVETRTLDMLLLLTRSVLAYHVGRKKTIIVASLRSRSVLA